MARGKKNVGEDAIVEAPISTRDDGLRQVEVTQEQAMQLQKECRMVGYWEEDGKKIALIRD